MLRILRPTFLIGASLFLTIWAWQLHDPHLFAFRRYETPVLVLLISLCFVVARRSRLRWLVLMPALLVLYQEGQYHQQKHRVLADTSPAMRQLGAHFVVGYTKLEDVQTLARQGLIGGIFLTRRNVQQRSIAALRDEIAGLQALRQQANLPPLIISTDQEGGIVSRLSPPLPQQEALANLVARYPDRAELLRQAEHYGAVQGAGLAQIGVNVNFSPVVDLKLPRAPNKLDFHSLIEQRAIAADPQLTSEVAHAYAQGLARNGVQATLKHFPGLGRVSDDTHHFSARLNTPLDELAKQDWLPYQYFAKQTKTLTMLSHVILEQADKENGASFSRAVVQDILRGRLQYQGLLITDDLTMAAAYHRGLCDVTVKSLNAGVDLLLISYDHEKIYPALHCAAKALAERRVDSASLLTSANRLQTWRASVFEGNSSQVISTQLAH